MDTTTTRFQECNGGPHAWHPWIQFETNPHRGTGLTLDVPESDLAQVLQIVRWKEMALEVSVRPRQVGGHS